MESLQEQLIKAGLVNKDRANKAKKDKQKQVKAERKQGGKKKQQRAPSIADKEREMRNQRDRELNRQKQQQIELRAAQAQIRQLIEANRIERGKGEIDYSFVYKNKVKKILVTEELRKQLSEGRMSIVRLVMPNETRFELVANAVAEKIAQRDANSVVQLNSNEATGATDDDPYADYKIPDDLTW
mgnify:FL=1